MLTGTSAADTLIGNDGNDTLLGQQGDDILNGERGSTPWKVGMETIPFWEVETMVMC